MKTLSNYISEKLIINKDFEKIPMVDDNNFDWNDLTIEDVDKYYRDMNYPPKKIYRKGNELYQWVKWWIMLTQRPMNKTELFYKSGITSSPTEKPTTHSTQFAQLSKENIIKYDPKTKKLHACKMSEWKP